MPETISSSIDIAASPEKIWSMISDLARMGEWSPESIGGSWQGGATCAVTGARFKGQNQNGKKKWALGSVVINEARAPQRLDFRVVRVVVPPLKGATWTYEITPTDGGCTVTETWTDTRSAILKPSVVGKIVTGVRDRKAFTKTSIATLANLKETARRHPTEQSI